MSIAITPELEARAASEYTRYGTWDLVRVVEVVEVEAGLVEVTVLVEDEAGRLHVPFQMEDWNLDEGEADWNYKCEGQPEDAPTDED